MASILCVAAVFLPFAGASVASIYSHTLGAVGQTQAFDYVVIGGGNSGLVATLRLSEANYSVAVVEAGGFYQDDAGNMTEIPGLESEFLKAPATIDWRLDTIPQPQLQGRSIRYSQGKTFGGSTARNGMAYQRGTTSFYDGWAESVGDPSYSWANMLPFLQKSVRYTPANATLRGGPQLAGDGGVFNAQGGPLKVSFWNYYVPVSAAFAKGMKALGYNEVSTLQSGSILGYSEFPATLDPEFQIRDSSESSFLRKAATDAAQDWGRKGRVTIYPNTLAKKILFDGAKAATGVEVASGSQQYTLNATREVILAAGVFRSPQMLMVSGVGPSQLLQELNVPIVGSVPAVGKNLRDHPGFSTLWSLNGVSQHRLWNNATYAAEANALFATSRSGPLTAFASNYILFDRFRKEANLSASTAQAISSFPADWPNTEFIWNAAGTPTNTPGDQLALGVVVLSPTSAGSVTINTTDTAANPLVDVQWFASDADREQGVAAVRHARRLAAAVAAEGVVEAELAPGRAVQSDAEVWAWIQQNAGPSHHAVGTCRMGRRDDPAAVVDAKGCVLGGVSALRVVDASVMPFVMAGQPMATVCT
ncbi:hypothetical protein PspLS_03904 [Pyricularia sp. CBS 133598]|nr:hypothetical protein PspLS_03904 [Pyricularia sp. CBS 133598]